MNGDVKLLEQELAFFEENKAEHLKQYKGFVILIKGKELVGIFPTAESAYQEGSNKFGVTPFFVKQVLENEPINFVPIMLLSSESNASL